MNYLEEQRGELEALREIYYNEIKVISEKEPISFSIKIRPQASAVVNEEIDSDCSDSDLEIDEAESELLVHLKFNLPPKYPDEKPNVEIVESENLDEDELADLLTTLDEKAEESLGTVMIFILVSDTVEWLIARTEVHNEPEIDEEAERIKKATEAEEARKFEGTPVNRQTFMVWRAKFDAEMLKLKLEQQKKLQALEQGAGAPRLTGREMFESDKTLAESDLNFVEDLDQSQLEALMQNINEADLLAEGDTEGDDDEEEDFALEDDDDDDDDDDEESD